MGGVGAERIRIERGRFRLIIVSRDPELDVAVKVTGKFIDRGRSARVKVRGAEAETFSGEELSCVEREDYIARVRGR